MTVDSWCRTTSPSVTYEQQNNVEYCVDSGMLQRHWKTYLPPISTLLRSPKKFRLRIFYWRGRSKFKVNFCHCLVLSSMKANHGTSLHLHASWIWTFFLFIFYNTKRFQSSQSLKMYRLQNFLSFHIDICKNY